MGIGPAEMAILFVVILLLFGAKKLPELARGMGKAMGEFKSARQEFEREIRRAQYEIQAEPGRPVGSSSRGGTEEQSPASTASAEPMALPTDGAGPEKQTGLL